VLVIYKLLIIDDESEIREGLSLVQWEKMGIRLIKCASHGLEALQFISEHPIDIVLTDIRMPFMDGIELMNILFREHPFIKVIILTGYSDFNYAKKAVELGAVDYLLKPTNFDNLNQTFERLVKKLDAVKQDELRRSVLLRKEVLLSKFLREEFLMQLFKNSVSQDEIEQRSAEGEIILDSLEYEVAIIRLDRIFKQNQVYSEQNLKLIAFSLDNILHDIWTDKGLGYYVVNKANAECYLLTKRMLNLSEWVQIKREVNKIIGLLKSTLSIGIGKRVNQITEMNISFLSAISLLERSTEEDCILQYSAASETEMGRSNELIALPAYVSKSKKEDSMIIQKSKQFMKMNFHRSITLKEVASQVYVTPGHLSTLFRETDESYLQYLTKLRMNKAVELLMDMKYKIYEIVELTGYSDQTYFTEVFKKYMGKTPMEYRSMKH
jgi:two-component system response regulator YesN